MRGEHDLWHRVGMKNALDARKRQQPSVHEGLHAWYRRTARDRGLSQRVLHFLIRQVGIKLRENRVAVHQNKASRINRSELMPARFHPESTLSVGLADISFRQYRGIQFWVRQPPGGRDQLVRNFHILMDEG